MKARMHPGPAVKVAAIATAVLAVAYAAAVIVLNLLVGSHLTGQSNARLADRLSDVRRDPSQLTQPAIGRHDPDDLDGNSAPAYLWAVNSSGTVTAPPFRSRIRSEAGASRSLPSSCVSIEAM